MILLEIERLIIRWLGYEDLEALVSIFSDPDVMRFLSWGILNKQMTQGRLEQIFNQYKQNGFGLFRVVLKSEERLIGVAGFQIMELDGHRENELIFRFHKDYWDQDYAVESTEAIVPYGFSRFGLLSVIVVASPENQSSYKITEHLGMVYEKDSIYNRLPVNIYRLQRPGYGERIFPVVGSALDDGATIDPDSFTYDKMY